MKFCLDNGNWNEWEFNTIFPLLYQSYLFEFAHFPKVVFKESIASPEAYCGLGRPKAAENA